LFNSKLNGRKLWFTTPLNLSVFATASYTIQFC